MRRTPAERLIAEQNAQLRCVKMAQFTDWHRCIFCDCDVKDEVMWHVELRIFGQLTSVQGCDRCAPDKADFFARLLEHLKKMNINARWPIGE